MKDERVGNKQRSLIPFGCKDVSSHMITKIKALQALKALGIIRGKTEEILNRDINVEITLY